MFKYLESFFKSLSDLQAPAKKSTNSSSISKMAGREIDDHIEYHQPIF